MKYFTADPHFDHAMMIKYCHRPFKNVDIMKRTLIANYNSMVTDDDELYFLGDISLRTGGYIDYYKNILKSINGTKYLILGNHDNLKPFVYMDIGFTNVSIWDTVDKFICVHDPAYSVVDSSKFWLCGHIHTLFKKQGNVLNVGVDVWDYKPVSLTQIYEEFGL